MTQAAKPASSSARTAVYFVASPLQYLVARQIAASHEAGARQVLVWYQSSVGPVVDAREWDAAMHMPWPRLKPLPGAFGRHRRLRQNLRDVAALVGRCHELVIHSAVFDTEAINYFLHGLPRLCGARVMKARILPDGRISMRRYPLSGVKRLAQQFRRLRRLAAPELRYQPFSGDRIGSDAAFCDRIYVLPGLPHEYPPGKVVELQPLAPKSVSVGSGPRRALVLDQTLVENGKLSAEGARQIRAAMRRWTAAHGIEQVHYKSHPKSTRDDLYCEGDVRVGHDEALEPWMAARHFDAVLGIRSSGLLFAREIYGDETPVIGFGWELASFKSDAERADMERAFRAAGVRLLPASP